MNESVFSFSAHDGKLKQQRHRYQNLSYGHNSGYENVDENMDPIYAVLHNTPYQVERSEDKYQTKSLRRHDGIENVKNGKNGFNTHIVQAEVYNSHGIPVTTIGDMSSTNCFTVPNGYNQHDLHLSHGNGDVAHPHSKTDLIHSHHKGMVSKTRNGNINITDMYPNGILGDDPVYVPDPDYDSYEGLNKECCNEQTDSGSGSDSPPKRNRDLVRERLRKASGSSQVSGDSGIDSYPPTFDDYLQALGPVKSGQKVKHTREGSNGSSIDPQINSKVEIIQKDANCMESSDCREPDSAFKNVKLRHVDQEDRMEGERSNGLQMKIIEKNSQTASKGNTQESVTDSASTELQQKLQARRKLAYEPPTSTPDENQADNVNEKNDVTYKTEIKDEDTNEKTVINENTTSNAEQIIDAQPKCANVDVSSVSSAQEMHVKLRETLGRQTSGSSRVSPVAEINEKEHASANREIVNAELKSLLVKRMTLLGTSDEGTYVSPTLLKKSSSSENLLDCDISIKKSSSSCSMPVMPSEQQTPELIPFGVPQNPAAQYLGKVFSSGESYMPSTITRQGKPPNTLGIQVSNTPATTIENESNKSPTTGIPTLPSLADENSTVPPPPPLPGKGNLTIPVPPPPPPPPPSGGSSTTPSKSGSPTSSAPQTPLSTGPAISLKDLQSVTLKKPIIKNNGK